MKILVLGGTVFLGRHLVEAALAAGHEVTLFNRGQHNPDLVPTVEKLRGDRDGNLEPLRGRRWDAAVDTSGYVPRIVRQSVEALADATDHYTFISTVSVYASFALPDIDESSELGTLEDESVEEITGETYGPLKVLCERAVEEGFPGRSLIIRPGLIVGPHDPTDRFTYWPHRVADGGDVLAPGRPERAVQFIDVRDLAEWTVRMVEAGATGIYNANGPAEPVPMEALLETCKAVSGSDARFIWAPEAFLQEQGVGQWMELPLWVVEEGHAGFYSINCWAAVEAGLTFRPVEETVRDTLAWDRTRPLDEERRAGMRPEREREILDAMGGGLYK